MSTSYSLDLRTRIAHNFNDNGNAEQVALSYDVSLSSVFKFARLYRENDLAPKSTDPKDWGRNNFPISSRLGHRSVVPFWQ